MKGWIALASVCFGALAFMACTGDDPAPAQSTSSSDASTNDGAGADANVDSAPPVDAGPDIEQDPNVYPAQHQPIPQVDNLGGPVLDHAKIVTVTFRGDTLRDSLRGFTHEVLASVWWKQTLGTFGFADGTNGGDFELDDVVSNKTTSDDDFRAYAVAQIQTGKLPAPDAQTLFVFYLPQSADIIDSQNHITCRDNGGYHSSFLVTLDSGDAGADAAVNVVDVAYAIVPRCYGGFQEATFAATHEIGEAVTEPTPGDSPTYYLMSNDSWIALRGSAGGEVGDLCWPLAYTESGYSVSRIWSNAAAKASKNPCQPTSTPYFGAAVRTTPRIVGGTKQNGRLAVKRGESLDAIIDFFSEAPLAHDVSLDVGVPNNVGDLDSMPSGVTVQLSRTQAHNGNGIVMTITVDASAKAGDIHMAVRSTLEPNDINDWPLILTIK